MAFSNTASHFLDVGLDKDDEDGGSLGYPVELADASTSVIGS